jgi:hypothetical protein
VLRLAPVLELVAGTSRPCVGREDDTLAEEDIGIAEAENNRLSEKILHLIIAEGPSSLPKKSVSQINPKSGASEQKTCPRNRLTRISSLKFPP